jgi:hypothetical protein
MRLFKIAISLAVFLFALPSVAEEIIYFKSGQSMPIRSHENIDGMVHVDLGDNAMLAFPESSIDRIEAAGKEIALQPSYGTASNRRVPSPQGSFPVTNTQRPNVEIPMDRSEESPIETDPDTGLAQYRPQGNSTAKNRRRVAVYGNTSILRDHPTRQGNGATFTGTTQVGRRHVIGSITPPRGAATQNPNYPEPVSLIQKARGAGDGAPSRPNNQDKGTPSQDGSGNR